MRLRLLNQLPKVKFFLVDKIKSYAIANLHKSESGELLILKLYLKAEELASSNGYFSLDAILKDSPDWLRKKIELHEMEEEGHVRRIQSRIKNITESDREIPLYLFSDRKIKKFYLLAQKFENKFEVGMIAPALVVGLILENLGVRIFQRHLRVLKRIDADSATYSMLVGLIRDEKRHIRGFLRSIRKLIRPYEYRNYRKLRKEALNLEKKGGLRSALAMFAISLLPTRILFNETEKVTR